MAEGTPGDHKLGGEALALGVLAAWSRAPYLVWLPQDPDGARFALGVARFDLAQGHPHPPGYPVYISLGKALWRLLGGPPAQALSALSALAFGALVALVYARARGSLGRSGALLAAWACALSPTMAVHGTRGLTDLPGAALAWAAVLLWRRPRWCWLLAGLLLGLRPSVSPLVLPALWCGWRARPDERRWCAGALGVGVAGWLLPTLAVTGTGVWWSLAWVHARGHFGAHGVTLAGEAGVPGRLGALGWGLWTHVLGGPWRDLSSWLWAWAPGSAVAVVLAWWARASREGGMRARVTASAAAPSREASPEALGAGLYLGWVFLGQNLEWQPRHLLPLAPCAAWGLAWAASRGGAPALAAVLALSLPRALASHALARTQAREAPPVVALGRCARGVLHREGALLAARQTAWWLRHELAPAPVLEVTDAREARALAARSGRRVYLVSEVPGAWEGARGSVCHVQGDRYVWSALYDLCLVRASGP
ncbi:MAG: glycosyltransferase family 39 protein [Deltaproteobacteria bacterium]|nr:glycosyltransferase family 39 protein [Deltaproteobacteria bacterium]